MELSCWGYVGSIIKSAGVWLQENYWDTRENFWDTQQLQVFLKYTVVWCMAYTVYGVKGV